jgi:hypothetical protein
MNKPRNNSHPVLLAAAVALCVLVPRAYPRVESEITSPEKRKISVDLAAALAKPSVVKPVPDTLDVPFSPPNFELTDAEEAAAAALEARRNAAAGQPVQSIKSDRDLLEEIVAKVRPSGSINLGGNPLLMFGKRFVKTGAHFTFTYKGIDYDLELTQIDGTNFTLRYKNEEITRPIQAAQPAKSPREPATSSCLLCCPHFCCPRWRRPRPSRLRLFRSPQWQRPPPPRPQPRRPPKRLRPT